MKTLIWFRNDLRVENNRLLDLMKSLVNPVALIIEEPEVYQSIDDFVNYGKLKTNYKLSIIDQFTQKASKLGIEVTVLKGYTKTILPHFCIENKIDKIVTSKLFDAEENKYLKELESTLSKNHIFIDYIYNCTWIPIDELPFPIKRTPEKFKEFMKEIKGLEDKYSIVQGEDDNSYIADLLDYIENNNSTELKKYVYSPNNNFYQFLPDLTIGRLSSPALLKWLEKRYKEDKEKSKMIKTFRQQLFMYDHMKLKYFADPELNFQVPTINREPEVKLFQKWVNGETKHPLINAIMKKLASSAKISLTSKKLAIDYYNHILELPPFWGYWYFKKQLMEYSGEVNAYLWKLSVNSKADKREIQTNISDLSLKLDPKNKFTNYWLSVSA